MKKSTIISTLLISLAYLSPIFTAFYFREKLSQSISTDGSDPFSSMMLFACGIHVFRYFKSLWKPKIANNQLLNIRLSIIWAFFYLCISGFIYYYIFYKNPNASYNPILILFGIFMMIDGNYQSVIISTNIFVFKSSIRERNKSNIYKKSQRLEGRFQFYFGLVIVILFIILPNTTKIFLFGILGILFAYYLGSCWVMYKKSQTIADTEVKTK